MGISDVEFNRQLRSIRTFCGLSDHRGTKVHANDATGASYVGRQCSYGATGAAADIQNMFAVLNIKQVEDSAILDWIIVFPAAHHVHQTDKVIGIT